MQYLQIPQIHTMKEVESFPPLKWRVESLLPVQGIAALYGSAGIGKSFLALDLAIAIASGKNWFGKRINPTTVRYCALEGFHNYSNRISAWKKENKQELPINMTFLSNALDLSDQNSTIEYMGSNQLLDLVEENSVLVIDTLNQASLSVDENLSSGMGSVIAALKKIQMTKKCLIILVHHSGKATDRGLRGHSSLIGSLETSIEVRAASKLSENKKWTLVKSKDSASNVNGIFVLKEICLNKIDEFGKMSTSCAPANLSFVQSADAPKKLLGKYPPAAFKILKKCIEEHGQLRVNGVPPGQASVAYTQVIELIQNEFIMSYGLSQTKSKEEARDALQRVLASNQCKGFPLSDLKKFTEDSQIWLVASSEAHHENPTPSFPL
jgi:hypothetical protein